MVTRHSDHNLASSRNVSKYTNWQRGAMRKMTAEFGVLRTFLME